MHKRSLDLKAEWGITGALGHTGVWGPQTDSVPGKVLDPADKAWIPEEI